ncbi:hypothetical protein GCM10009689_03990 [Brevibacterium antiquum]
MRSVQELPEIVSFPPVSDTEYSASGSVAGPPVTSPEVVENLEE